MASPQPERPAIDPGYGIGDPQYPFTPLDWSEVTKQIAESRNYWIATTRPSGRAHSVPVWGVWTDDAFWFFTTTESLTGRNLAQQAYAEVHLESGDDVVLLFGEFEIVSSTDAVLQDYQNKYGLFDENVVNDETPVYRLKLDKAIAWREQDFPNSATRWRF